MSRFVFFSRGRTKVDLKLLGNVPEASDLSMICVIVGSSVSVFFKSQVGKGYRLQDFVGEFLMIFNISSAVMSVHFDRPSPRELVIGDRIV